MSDTIESFLPLQPDPAETLPLVAPGIELGNDAIDLTQVLEYKHGDQVYRAELGAVPSVCEGMRGFAPQDILGAVALGELGREMRAASAPKNIPARKNTSETGLSPENKILMAKKSPSAEAVVMPESPVSNHQGVHIEQTNQHQRALLELMAIDSPSPKAAANDQLSILKYNKQQRNPQKLQEQTELQVKKLPVADTAFKVETKRSIVRTSIPDKPKRLATLVNSSQSAGASEGTVRHLQTTDSQLKRNRLEQPPAGPGLVEPTILKMVEDTEFQDPTNLHELALNLLGMPATEQFTAENQDRFQEYTEIADQTAETKAESSITTEFIAQVLPDFSPQIVQQLSELAPEKLVEIEAQVELLVVVVDRYRELVAAGNDQGKEAQQIEVFLKREFEQLLLTINNKNIKPVEDLITVFIKLIRSDSYLSPTAAIKLMMTEAYEEGTHEKKLFDEQSVFAKAQLASVRLGQGIGTMIGRLAVNRSAA